MIIYDENSDHYKRVTHTKWKQTLPKIELDDALFCEKQLVEFANGKQSEEEALKKINEHLTEKGLIEKNE